MKTFIKILVLTLFSISTSYSQEKYFTNAGFISFFSHSPLEDIKAENEQVLSVFDSKTNELVIYVLMKSFIFEKALMQEHFNENYVESDKFPKAIFKGKVNNIDINKTTAQSVNLVGSLTIHGKTNDVNTEAEFLFTKEVVKLKGTFDVLVADYDIRIPRTVINNIAKTIEISFNLDQKPYTN